MQFMNGINDMDNRTKEVTLMAVDLLQEITRCELDSIPLVIKFDPLIGWIIKVGKEVKQYPAGDFEMVAKETIERIRNV